MPKDLLRTLEDLGMPFEDLQKWERLLSNLDAVSKQVGAIKVDGIAGLSEITTDAGVILAGEFRSGNNELPGDGFTGVRMGYPGFTYGGETWNFVGVNNDVLQAGLRASDGKFLAGAGAAILDATGITLIGGSDGASDNATIKWVNSSDDRQLNITSYDFLPAADQAIALITANELGEYALGSKLALTAYDGLGTGVAASIEIKSLVTVSSIVFQGGDAGNNAFFNSFGVGETVFNERGNDINFRVEGDNDQNLLFVDAGNDAITIGSTTELAKLGVDGNADEVQFAVQAHSSQANNIKENQDSAGNVLSGADKRGILFSDGGIDNNSVYIGSNAGNIAYTDAIQNVGIGRGALRFLTTGDDNVLIGAFAGDAILTGSSNMGIGAFSLSNVTEGNSNTGIGTNTLLNVITGDKNTAIGINTMRNVDADASNNVAIGSNAGFNSDSDNIFIGSFAGYRQTGSNLFVIDSQTSARADIATELTNSILYGVMAAAPANQTLRINAALTVDQSLHMEAIETITASSATLDNTNHVVLCDASSNNITTNLPAVSGNTGLMYHIKKIDSSGNTVTVDANSSELIDGATTAVITTQWESIQIVSDGSAWYII